MAAKTAHLNPFFTASAFEQRPEGGGQLSGITGHAEIGPFEVIVGPGRIPLRIEIETEVGSLLAGVGTSGIKGHGHDLDPVRQYDEGSVLVHGNLLVVVVGVSAFCGFIVHVPMNLALRTHDYGPGVNHALHSRESEGVPVRRIGTDLESTPCDRWRGSRVGWTALTTSGAPMDATVRSPVDLALVEDCPSRQRVREGQLLEVSLWEVRLGPALATVM
jgi:hypothetical protein